MTTLFEEAIASGASVAAFEVLGDWIDVGYPNQLKIAREGDAGGSQAPRPLALPTERTERKAA